MKNNHVEKFIGDLNNQYNDIKKAIKFLNMYNDKKFNKKINNTLDILDKKIKNINSSDSIDDLKKYIKLKKLLNDDKEE